MEYNANWRNRPESSPGNIVQVCRELSTNLVSSSEKNVNAARSIIQKLFKNKSLDLCSVLPPQYVTNMDNPFNAVYDLTNGYSPFFDTVIEDDSLCDELFNAIMMQCEYSCMEPNIAKDSVLMNVFSTYVTRMLPCDETIVNMPQKGNKTPQTIRTPLQLFRASSPLVNRISIESHADMISPNTNLQPRLVNIFSDLVIKTCSTTTFPTPNRLLMLRYLLKQFHVFCLFETRDEYIDSLKNALMIQPPFLTQLYTFFSTSLDHCPTSSLFKDITMCWLTYCRPWRYQNIGASPAEPIQVSRFLPFARKNFDFYRNLLGKIIKKFSSFDMSLELTQTMKAVIEFSWKEPQCIILRNIGLDVHPHVVTLLEQMRHIVVVQRNLIKKEEQENSGFFNSLFGTTSTNKREASAQLIQEIESMMRDCDKYLATKLIAELEPQNKEGSDETLGEKGINKMSTTSLLNETPKSGFLLPEHYLDHDHNLMILTPNGKKQLVSGERKFDYTLCAQRRSDSSPRRFEFGPFVTLTTYLATKASSFSLVKSLGQQYNNPNLIGTIARSIMYPSFPPMNENDAVPCYSPRIRIVPPLLKLRIFASYHIIAIILFMLFWQLGGFYFLIPAIFVIFITLVIAIAIDHEHDAGTGANYNVTHPN